MYPQTEFQLIDRITLIKDETTPSGVKLAVPDGFALPMSMMQAVEIRYQQPGSDHRQHYAWCLLDLVAQNVAGASGLNGPKLVQQSHIMLLEHLLNAHIFTRQIKPKQTIERFLNVLISDY